MISPSQRPLPDNTQHLEQTNSHAPGGIRTHDRSRRAAKDLRLIPRGHWDRHRIFVHWNASSIKENSFLQRYVGEGVPINDELNISNTSILTSQRTVMVSHYKENVNTIQRNDRCLLWYLHETYRHTLWQNAGLLMFKTVGTYSYHLTLRG